MPVAGHPGRGCPGGRKHSKKRGENSSGRAGLDARRAEGDSGHGRKYLFGSCMKMHNVMGRGLKL